MEESKMKKHKWLAFVGILLICAMIFGSIMTVYAAPTEEETAAESESMEGESTEGESADSEGESAESEGEGVPSFLLAQVPLLLPPELTDLETVEAEPWLQISETNPGIEGPVFDEEGMLYLCDSSPVIPENHILKISPDKEIETIWTGTEDPNGLALDQDGRLYAVCREAGVVLAMDKDGSNVETITPAYEGQPLTMNDCCISPEGNLYVTDWRGTIVDPIGGVYLLTKESGFTEAVQVVGNLASPNGISLSPAGDALWVGVTLSNCVLKVSLAGEGQIADMLGIVPVYYNTGTDGPDSNKVDSAGNVYQAFMPGGRALVFDCNGIPVRNILIPERAEGRLTMSTNLIIRPGTTEGYLLTSDFMSGAWIYQFEALAPGK